MAPIGGKSDAFDLDMSFDLKRLFDNYNFDHIPIEKRLKYFKQRDLSQVKYYKAAVKIFGAPSIRTRAIVAPPMETPFKHRLGIYANVFKPPTPPALNGALRPPPEPTKLETEEEVAQTEEEKHAQNYSSIMDKRKQLRKDLDSLTPNEAYLARKKDKSEVEKRVQERYKSNRPEKPEEPPSPEIVQPAKSFPNVPTMSVPPPDALQILDTFLSHNNLRLMDLFLTADKNKSWSLSKQEFLNAVKQAEIPLTGSEVDAIIVTLDADLDEKLTYQDLNKGLQLWRKHRRLIKKQSEETEKKCLKTSSKEHRMKIVPKQEERNFRTAVKEPNKRFINPSPKHNKKDPIFSDLNLESKEYCKGARDFHHQKENSKRSTEQFCDESTEVAKTLKKSAESSAIVTPAKYENESYTDLNYGAKIAGHDKKLNQVIKQNNYKFPDLELSRSYSEEDDFLFSENPLQNYFNGKISQLNKEANVFAPGSALSDLLVSEKKAFPNLNPSESLQLDSLCDADLVPKSKEVTNFTAAARNINEEELIQQRLEEDDAFTEEARPPSHKSSTHSRTSTPNSLEPPESNLRMKSWLPAPSEELVEIRKHDRFVLSRNKIHRRLPLEKRKDCDEPPGVIKVGYKPIDDHCSESTLGGDNAGMVNQFRRWQLKEYFNVKRLLEENGLNFTQETLDKVLLYPGDKPTTRLRKRINMPAGPLTNELDPFTKMIQSKKSPTWHIENKELYKQSDIGNRNGKDKDLALAGDESRNGYLSRKPHESQQRSRRKTHQGYLTAEDVYPSASTKIPKVYNENLSSGRALISRKVDTWMTFEDYSKYTENRRHRHINKRSNPNAIWPGYMLNKLRLYMDGDLTLVDGRGRQIENRDSSAYKGFGTGMYNGRGNALFCHTAQPKRAYPGYNNDLLTWPVGRYGVRYGNIDEHRFVK